MAANAKKTNSHIQIQSFRTSFVWTDTFLDLLDDAPNRPSFPLGKLGRKGGYRFFFDATSQKKADREPPYDHLRLPWQIDTSAKLTGAWFWRQYFAEGNLLEDANVGASWQRLVPFRWAEPVPSPTQLAVEGQAGVASIQTYIYPFGSAIIANYYYHVQDQALSLEEAAILALDFKQAPHLRLTTNGASTTKTLDAVAGQGLDELRAIVLGKKPDQPRPVRYPNTVFTVIEGKGDDVATAAKPSDEVIRFLEVVTNWGPLLKAPTPLPADVETCQDQPSRPPGSAHVPADVIYSRGLGKAIWFPGSFTQPEDAGLGCYHRNLVFATLQVASLGRFIVDVARRVNAGTTLSSTSLRECAGNATERLARIYKGKAEATYRSKSLRRQILEANLHPSINVVRHALGLPEVAL